jgi:hypothetical protein
LTQAAEAAGDNVGPAPKRIRTDALLTAEEINANFGVTSRALQHILSPACSLAKGSKIKYAVKSEGDPVLVSDTVDKCFRMIEEMGLGLRTSRGLSICLVRPPDESMAPVGNRLVEALRLSRPSGLKIKEALAKRDVSAIFDMTAFERVTGYLLPAVADAAVAGAGADEGHNVEQAPGDAVGGAAGADGDQV